MVVIAANPKQAIRPATRHANEKGPIMTFRNRQQTARGMPTCLCMVWRCSSQEERLLQPQGTAHLLALPCRSHTEWPSHPHQKRLIKGPLSEIGIAKRTFIRQTVLPAPSQGRGEFLYPRNDRVFILFRLAKPRSPSDALSVPPSSCHLSSCCSVYTAIAGC